jgi:hypothetical protein
MNANAPDPHCPQTIDRNTESAIACAASRHVLPTGHQSVTGEPYARDRDARVMPWDDRARTLRRFVMRCATPAGERIVMPAVPPGVSDDTSWARQRHRRIVLSRRQLVLEHHDEPTHRPRARAHDGCQSWRPEDTGQLLHNLLHDPGTVG